MNLQEFLDYRKYCPVCQSQLVTSFHSHRKQTIKIQDNRLVAIFRLEPLNKSSTVFKAGYAFDFTTLSFGIEFFDKTDIHSYELVHKFYIDRFLELHNNLRMFKFYRDCTYCNQFQYASKNLKLDFKTATMDEIEIGFEELQVVESLEENFRIYRIVNAYGGTPTTHLSVCKSSFARTSIRLDMPAESMRIDLPLVPITDPNEMAKRFSNLLVFA